MTNGTPRSVTPAPSKLPAVVRRCAANHKFGIWWSRCISFESSGFPETVCWPETTQLFDPGRKESDSSRVNAEDSAEVTADGDGEGWFEGGGEVIRPFSPSGSISSC